jgi:putative glutamine transport system ATP-binding protein
MSIIEFNHVDKYYGKMHALKNINLSFEEGEVTTLIGPSGSGKSTLLRCINGLEETTSGELNVFGQNIADPKTDKRLIRQKIGMVFQHFELYPHMSVLDNVILAPMNVLGISKEEAIKSAEGYLTRVNMWDKKDSYPDNLSGGQKQRVAIARGLAMKPDAMLFDEPTSALDPETIVDVLDVMKDIALKDGMTMIVVTHEMGFAREVADRVVFMTDGEIIEDRPSEEFFENPKDERARNFINQVFAY